MKRSSLVLGIALVAMLAVPLFGHAAAFDPSLLSLDLGLMLAGVAAVPADLFLSKRLRQERAALVEENRKVLDRIAAEKDAARVKELETEWDKRDQDIISQTAAIARAEKQEANDAELAQSATERRSGREAPASSALTEAQSADAKARYKRAFWDGMKYGVQALDPDEQLLLTRNFRKVDGEPMSTGGREVRAMSSTNAAGGYTIPEGFYNELQNNMLFFGGVREMARVWTTPTGNSVPVPTVDDTANEAAIVGEGSALTSPQDPTFGVVTFGAFTYRTLCLVPLELLQDSAFDLEQWVRSWIAERIARGTNRHFTTGNGSTQPNGVIPASSSGVTAASATSVSYADLVDLEHSVDPAYRRSPKAGFMMADGTIKVLKKLVDLDSRPIWAPGIAVREPDTILGYKYAINQHMAAVAASNKSIAFGDWSKYWIRDVSGMLLIRANELHIANGQIGFYAFSRHDGDIVDAGTDPIKHLTHPSPN